MIPTNVKVDFKAKAGYVRYRDDQATNTIDVWEDGAVAVDFDGAPVHLESALVLA